MAKTASPVASESVSSAPSLAAASQDAAKQRSELLKSITFSEAASIAISSARWVDVLAAADGIAKVIDDVKIAEKTVSAQARKVAKLAPRECAMFRLAVGSYSLGKDRANPTQSAELAGKLPSLRITGTLKNNQLVFGGIALPPALGEF